MSFTQNCTSCGDEDMQSILNAARVWLLCAEVSAIKATVFNVNCFNVRLPNGTHVSRNFNNTSTFQVQVYLGSGGLDTNIPFSSLTTMGCSPKGYPSTGSIIEDNADLYELIVE